MRSINSAYKTKLYLYYESPSHYFEEQFLVLTYHMFQLYYVLVLKFPNSLLGNVVLT